MSAREIELLAQLTDAVRRLFPGAPVPGNAPGVVAEAKKWLARWTVTVEAPTLMTESHVLRVLGRLCSCIVESPIATPSSVDEVRYCWQLLGIVLEQQARLQREAAQLSDGDVEAAKATERKLELAALREAVEVHYAITRPTMFDIFAHLSANEMFFIDGDSLVLEAMSKPLVDWELMQPLHVSYFVQRILQELVVRGARFHIVFFESSRWIWKAVPQKLFVRDLICETLLKLDDKQAAPFVVKLFDSWYCDAYRSHVKQYDPEFVMMTDGESAAEQTLLQLGYTTLSANTFRSSVGDEAVGSNLAVYYHAFMMDTICSHAQVVFSSRMVLKDNAAIAFVVRSSSDRFAQYLTIHDDVVKLAEDIANVDVPAAPVKIAATKRAQLKDSKCDLFVNFRERIVSGAVAAYIVAEERTEAEFALCKAALITAFAASSIPAAARAQPAADAPELSAFLDKLAPFLTAVLSLIGVSGSGSEFDPIDGHLLFAFVRLLKTTAAKDLLSEDIASAVDAVWQEFIGEEDSATESPLSDLPALPEPPKIAAPTAEPLKHELVSGLAAVLGVDIVPSGASLPEAASPSLQQLKGWVVVQAFNEHNDVINVGKVKDEKLKTDTRSQRRREKKAARYATVTREDAESLGAGLFLGKHEKLALVVEKETAGAAAPQQPKASKVHAGQKKRKEPTSQERVVLEHAQKKLMENNSKKCEKLLALLNRSESFDERITSDKRDQEINALQKSLDTVSFDDRVVLDDEVVVSASFSKLAVWRALVVHCKCTERDAAFRLECFKNVAAFVDQDHRRFADHLDGALLACVYESAGSDWKNVAERFVQQICLTYIEAHAQAAIEHRMMKLAYHEWLAERTAAREASRKPDMKKAVALFRRIHAVLSRIEINKIRLPVEDISLVRGAVRHLEFDEEYNTKVDGMIAKFQDQDKLGSLPDSYKPRYRLLGGQGHTVARFQLCEMGELLERPVPPFHDPRVAFKPDEWQRELLDVVDARGSAIVCAPTSAGKTFISFYCMKHTLMNSNKRVVVYVAPTRALINQATADVCARFGSKTYSAENASMHVCGTLGGDDFHYYHDSCQVLVTLPDVFETMLLSPKYTEWAKRIDYVIFDEIHSMESSGNGPVWERIISLTTAPFVALSATLGETEQFCEWLNRIQRRVALSGADTRDYSAKVIPQPGKRIERWNDIEKYVYQPPQGCSIPFRSMEENFEFNHVKNLHPLSTVTLTMLRGKFPPDLTLVPKECVKLYEVMKDKLTPFRENYDGIDAFDDLVNKLRSLEPDRFFAADRHIVQNRAREYERTIKAELLRWAKLGVETLGFTLEPMEPQEIELFHADMTDVVSGILGAFQQDLVEGEEILKKHSLFVKNAAEAPFPDSLAFVKKNILNVLRELKSQKKGPTIVFSFESEDCETLVEHVVTALEEAEAAYRKTAEFENYAKKIEQRKQSLETARRVANANAGRERGGDDAEGGRQKEKEKVTEEVRDDDVEDIPEILPEFTFLGRGINQEQLKTILKDCEERGSDLFARAIRRGICMHHAGVSGKLRGHAERMFRLLSCNVIFATETLALGIHSPCRSVVLAGDHILLNTTQFRQMMGRAGRRGLDYLGHLIMMGVSLKKVNRLMTSDLMVIKGHVQVDGITQLRLLQLHDYEKHAEIVQKDYTAWKAQVHKIAARIFTNPLFFLGRERIHGGNMEGFQVRLLQAMLRYYYVNGLHFSESLGPSALGSLVTHVMHVFRNAGAHHSGFAFANMLTSGALTNAKYANNIVDPSEDATFEAMAEALSYAFTVNTVFNIPLELHRSALRDPAVEELWNFPGRKFSRIQHRVALTPMRGLNLSALESRNAAVLALLSAFYAREASLLPSAHNAKLPFMVKFRNAQNASIFGDGSDAEVLISKLLPMAQSFSARHPLAAISGCGDRFANLDELALTLRDDGLFADMGMFPLVDFTDNSRHEGSQIVVNACVVDFMRVGAQTVRNEYRRSLLQSLNGLSQNDSYSTLDRAEMVLSNLQMQKPEPSSNVIETLRTLVPEGAGSSIAQTLLKVCEKLVSTRRQIDNQAYLDRREQQDARDREEAVARKELSRRGQ